MKHSEYLVTIPPDEVIARLSSVIETSWKRTLVGLGNQKKYLGSINGRQFWFRVWRASRNSFAPTCTGQVIQEGAGSKIVVNASANSGCLYVFGVFFMLLFLLLGLITFWVSGDPQMVAKSNGFPFFLLPLGFAAVFAVVFLILRATASRDVVQLRSVFPSLFSDVLINPPGQGKGPPPLPHA